MKVNRKITKKIKRIFSLYNLMVFVCVIFILISMFILFKPEKQETNKIDVVQNEEKVKGEITEEEARKLAKKQFKNLGEKNIKEDELNVKKIERSGEEYYYISSAKNTMEILIKSGKITRINSAIVEE